MCSEEDFVDDKKGGGKQVRHVFLNCAACGEHFPLLMPKVPQRRPPRVFRTIFKLEEEVNNEVEVTLLEEDFAKALKQQILL